MKFTQTPLEGSFVIEIEKNEDERGFFARIFDQKQFLEHNLDVNLSQSNISFNQKKGTIRGIHFQKTPYEETKIVRCTKGKIFDVIVDLRKNSTTFHQWFGIELSSENYKMLYIPKGFGHGFQTLEDCSEICYMMSDCFEPNYADGIRWDDKKLNIKWPLNPTKISKIDKSFQLLQ